MFDKKELELLNRSLRASKARAAEWMNNLSPSDGILLKEFGREMYQNIEALCAKVQIDLDKARQEVLDNDPEYHELVAEDRAMDKTDLDPTRQIKGSIPLDNYIPNVFQLLVLRTSSIPSGIAHDLLHSLQQGAGRGSTLTVVKMKTNADATRAYLVYSDEMGIDEFYDIAREERVRYRIEHMNIHCYTIV